MWRRTVAEHSSWRRTVAGYCLWRHTAPLSDKLHRYIAKQLACSSTSIKHHPSNHSHHTELDFNEVNRKARWKVVPVLKHDVMNMHGGEEIKFHAFLT
jgi:hypothetical protein